MFICQGNVLIVPELGVLGFFFFDFWEMSHGLKQSVSLERIFFAALDKECALKWYYSLGRELGLSWRDDAGAKLFSIGPWNIIGPPSLPPFLPSFLLSFLPSFLSFFHINAWLALMRPLLGTWHTTQACALTGNLTSDPLVHRSALNPLSHTIQSTTYISVF